MDSLWTGNRTPHELNAFPPVLPLTAQGLLTYLTITSVAPRRKGLAPIPTLHSADSSCD
jgi:hypothetical protein